MSKSDFLPLIALVNSKSGGQDGPKLIQKLHEHLPKENVFDLAEGGPALGLAKCKNQRVRVLVCGGDGTVAWVLSEIKKMHLEERLRPVVAILPLGTANDLSRTLKWGPGWAGEKLSPLFPQIEQACVVHMDQWNVVSTPLHDGHQEKLFVMNNYFSVGSDAEVALKFHRKREEKPNLFKNRTRNKGWYAKFALTSFLQAQPLASGMEVEVDGKKLELPSKLSVLLVLNLPSYASGMTPWGDPNQKSKKPNSTAPAIDDGRFEVVGIKGLLHASGLQIHVAKGKRLAQGSSLTLKLKRPIAAQVDGEPWMQDPAVITITHAGHAMMLANSPAVKPAPCAVVPPPIKTVSIASLALEGAPHAAPAPKPVVARTVSTNTLSTLQYGPVPLSKRKKNRFYCDNCNFEFFLPYMLENHKVKGCSIIPESSSSSSTPLTPARSSSFSSTPGSSSLNASTTKSMDKEDSTNKFQERAPTSLPDDTKRDKRSMERAGSAVVNIEIRESQDGADESSALVSPPNWQKREPKKEKSSSSSYSSSGSSSSGSSYSGESHSQSDSDSDEDTSTEEN